MIGRNEATPVPDRAREGLSPATNMITRMATPEEREKYGIGAGKLSLTEEKLKAWVNKGMSVKEISEAAGVKESSVRVYASQHKIKLNRLTRETKEADVQKEIKEEMDRRLQMLPEPKQEEPPEQHREKPPEQKALQETPKQKPPEQKEITATMKELGKIWEDKPAEDQNLPDAGVNIKTIDFIENKDLNFNRGTIVNYVSQAGEKGKAKEIEYLEIAQWYLNREIARLKKLQGNIDKRGAIV